MKKFFQPGDFLDLDEKEPLFLKKKKILFKVIYLYWQADAKHRTQALVFLISRVWVQVPVLTLVSLSKMLYHNLLCSSDWTLSDRSCFQGLVVHVKDSGHYW